VATGVGGYYAYKQYKKRGAAKGWKRFLPSVPSFNAKSMKTWGVVAAATVVGTLAYFKNWPPFSWLSKWRKKKDNDDSDSGSASSDGSSSNEGSSEEKKSPKKSKKKSDKEKGSGGNGATKRKSEEPGSDDGTNLSSREASEYERPEMGGAGSDGSDPGAGPSGDPFMGGSMPPREENQDPRAGDDVGKQVMDQLSGMSGMAGGPGDDDPVIGGIGDGQEAGFAESNDGDFAPDERGEQQDAGDQGDAGAQEAEPLDALGGDDGAQAQAPPPAPEPVEAPGGKAEE